MAFDFWVAYWAFVAFVFGAIVGSFLNVCIWRLPRGESLSDPPSHCPSCNHRLQFWPDMVPMASQLWFRSRCRYCGTRFSWRYFWVELITALCFTGVYLQHIDEPIPAFAGMLFVAALVTIVFIDLDHYVIPDVMVVIALVGAFVRDGFLISRGARPLWFEVWDLPWKLPIPLSVFGALVAFWCLWQFAALASAAIGREAMGAGDSLLLAAMGAYLIPWPLVALAFMLAVFLGAAGGIAGMLFASRAEQRQAAAALEQEAAAPEVAEADVGETPDAPDYLETVAVADVVRPQAGSESEIGGSADVPASDGPERRAPASLEEPLPGLRLSEEPLSEHAVAVEGAPAAVRGTALAPAVDEELEAPHLPAASRWGRLWTVLGTWVALLSLWRGAVVAATAPAVGVGLGLAGLVGAGLLLWFGIRMWLRGDREWLPAMDELFEGDPGPRFIPFGPYLVAGTLIAMFAGRPLLEWYARSMGLDLSGLPWDVPLH